MPRFRELPGPTLDRIARRVAPKLDRIMPSLGGAPGEPLGLFETAEVWMLEGAQILEPSNDLRRLAKPTGRWHHQIKGQNDRQARAYARTKPLGLEPDDWALAGVFGAGGTAGKIDECIRWIDANIGDTVPYEARLLEVPDYRVTAFWLLDRSPPDARGEDLVIVADKLAGSIEERRRYTAREFLTLLRRERHVQGLEF